MMVFQRSDNSTVMKISKRLIIGLIFCALVVLHGTSCSQNSSRPVTHTVVISGMKFHPVGLTVNKGDTVVWVNKDLVTHNITAYPDSQWTSGPITSGASWKKVVNKGFDYFAAFIPR